MEDSEIIKLYFIRDEQAIAETQRQYGGYCTTIAYNILSSFDEENACVEGSWNITVLLPAAETAEKIAITDTENLAKNISAEICDVKITESSLDIALRFFGAEYTLVGSDNFELSRAAEPDTLFFSVEALTESGTRIPTQGATGRSDEENGIWHNSVLWLSPIDPETIVSLVFSDGETETIIDIG